METNQRVWNWKDGKDADGNTTITFVHVPVGTNQGYEYDCGFETLGDAMTQYFADNFTNLEDSAEGYQLALVRKQVTQAIAGRLKESRIAAGLSVGQVAKLRGISRDEVEEFESGKDFYYYFKEDLSPYAHLYGVHVEFLLGIRTPYFSPATMHMINSITNEKDREKMLRLLERFGGDPLPENK